LWQLKAGICPAGEDDDANSASQETSKPAQDPLALLKPHEAAIIALAASKGTIITAVHELPAKWLQSPQKLIAAAQEYAAKNTVTKEVAK
jgi:hypothetical protein